MPWLVLFSLALHLFSSAMARLSILRGSELLVESNKLYGAARCVLAGDYEATAQNDPDLATQVQSLQYALDIFDGEDDLFCEEFLPESLQSHIVFSISHLVFVMQHVTPILDGQTKSRDVSIPSTKQVLQSMLEYLQMEIGDIEV